MRTGELNATIEAVWPTYPLRAIERAARTCYRSEGSVEAGSDDVGVLP